MSLEDFNPDPQAGPIQAIDGHRPATLQLVSDLIERELALSRAHQSEVLALAAMRTVELSDSVFATYILKRCYHSVWRRIHESNAAIFLGYQTELLFASDSFITPSRDID